MQRELGSQVVLLLEDVIDRRLTYQEVGSTGPILHSSPWHDLTIRALRGGERSRHAEPAIQAVLSAAIGLARDAGNCEFGKQWIDSESSN
jgi:hypothetical protein